MTKRKTGLSSPNLGPTTAARAVEELLEVAAQAANDPTRFSKYSENPEGFCREVLGVQLWEGQARVLQLVKNHRPVGRVAVRSGHNCGKSFVTACVALWWFYARQGMVIVSAPTKKHVEDVLLRQIHSLLQKARLPLPGEPNKNDIVIDRTWYLTTVATDQVDAFQGRHHPRLLIIGDEAPGMSEQTHLEMSTCASSDENCILLIGNPTTTSGTFYNAFKSPDWDTTKMSCLDHPNVVEGKMVIPGAVTRKWVEQCRRKWGENHPFWPSRILGDFPGISIKGVIPLSWVEACIDEVKRSEEAQKALQMRTPVVAGLDVARYGNNSSVFIARCGDAVLHIESWAHRSLTETAGMAKRLCEELDVAQLVVDASGIGAGVYDILAEQSLKFAVLGYNGGHSAFNKGAYSNRRCELWWHLRQRFEKKRLWLPDLSHIFVPQLILELTTPEYEVTGNGRIKVEAKEKLLERGESSPDYADALTLCFAADLDPEADLLPQPERGQDPQAFLQEVLPETWESPFGQLPWGM